MCFELGTFIAYSVCDSGETHLIKVTLINEQLIIVIVGCGSGRMPTDTH